ncbi:MAG: hypothetical protein ACI9VT_000432 [Psychroserpens sp.]|jgi:hypothetical protein
MNEVEIPRVLLCGYERGATTLLSEILRANGYESGFECGVLLSDTINDFKQLKPYCSNFLNGWKVPKGNEKLIFESRDHIEFYSKLFKYSGVSMTSKKYFDKTPAYMKELGKCLYRAPFIERAIVITRDPRSLFYSWAKRAVADGNVEAFIIKNIDIYSRRYLSYFAGAIAESSNAKVMFVSFEDICTNEVNTCKQIGYFTDGVAFRVRKGESSFANVYSDSMVVSKINEYEEYISKDVCSLILEKCALASKFFSSIEEKIKYYDLFNKKDSEIKNLLKVHNIENKVVSIKGTLFNPWVYLFMNDDVLTKGVNPMQHFKNNGLREGRQG